MIQLVTIKFPDITLSTRDAHKLRGYFGSLFKEHSPLLHNHYETGEFRYKYPLIQYKVLNEIPTLVALQEGAQLLLQLFLNIEELEIDNKIFPVLSKNIKSELVSTGYTTELQQYRFQTLWMALNQENHWKFVQEKNEESKRKFLDRILTGNVLSFFKGLNIRLGAEHRLMTKVILHEKTTKFKDKEMLAFSGSFIINAELPDGIGLGKAVSRGFGTIVREK